MAIIHIGGPVRGNSGEEELLFCFAFWAGAASNRPTPNIFVSRNYTFYWSSGGTFSYRNILFCTNG